MVLNVRDKLDFFRPVNSASRARDSGAAAAMICNIARFGPESIRAKLSAELNQTFGSFALGLYCPRAIAMVRAFISS
jgi:hypothetical protein